MNLPPASPDPPPGGGAPGARPRRIEKAATSESRRFARFAARPFERHEHEQRRRVFNVDYRAFRFADGGRLFITRDGWRVARLLDPARWFAGRAYAQQGKRLPASTGTVYRLEVGAVAGRTFALVVKFSRFAQPLAADMSTTFREETPPEAIAKAAFNSPFLEFARVYALRDAHRRTGRRRLLTKRPLAVYEVPEVEPDWRLGRDVGTFSLDAQIQHLDQEEQALPEEERVELVRERSYVLLYGWVAGEDAATLREAGRLTDEEMNRLVRETEDELRFQGFAVLDHKANHVILRQRREGSLLRDRQGRYVYALIDFELLLPLAAADPAQERERLETRVRSLVPTCPYFAKPGRTCEFAAWRRHGEQVDERLTQCSVDTLAALLRSHRECYRQRKTALRSGTALECRP